ncbi:MAG: 1-(5-phosphoribosyl)-5-[(5-phosphoribosylamino)methylideneamino]imidazole-4-carboxamide isomerase [Clostridium sp.]|nr:1-(5-phosphoribosyl)-5-[(5-phosphoribosylamino)methylideneamino]imidazole-4-carboxamide isomerase [Clostridium sp.]
MLIFPAIDLYEGKAVRLLRGDYRQMTVYSDHPIDLVRDFEAQGASCLHVVDLEGAKSGTTPNLELIRSLKAETSLFTEVGGGIRTMETVRRYMNAGVDRVILGTAAVKDPSFVEAAANAYGERVAVGVDIRDGQVAIHGWTESSGLNALEFCKRMQSLGIRTLICTDISKDGAMQGTNHGLYRTLSEQLSMQIVASGGVSSLDDVKKLAALNLYGAIIGKAYYTGAIQLKEAIEIAADENKTLDRQPITKAN